MLLFLSHWRLIAVLLISAISVALAIVISRIAGDEVAGVGSAFSSVVPPLKDFLIKLGSVFWTAWCYLYTIRWKLRRWGRYKTVNSVLAVLLFGSFVVVIELALSLFRFFGDYDRTKQLGSQADRLIPHFHTPLWAEVILFVLSLMMLRHHMHEWKQRRQNMDMPQVIAALLLEKDQSLLSPDQVASRGRFVKQLFHTMQGVLERVAKREVVFSLMEVDPAEGCLQITYVYPPSSPISGNLRLKIGEGAAGEAYTSRSAILVPSTRHRIGINIDSNRTIGAVYTPDQSRNPYCCVQCMPIFDSTGVSAVLSIATTKRGSFDEFELNIGQLMAAMLSSVD